MSDDADRQDAPEPAPGPRETAAPPGPQAGPDTGAGPQRTAPGRAEPPAGAPDADAWAAACAEDLAAEKARRRARQGPPPGSAAEELRRLADAVAERLGGLSGIAAPLFGAAAQGTAQQLVRQARAAVEPVLERHPEVLDHLAAAGSELLAAYRSAVTAQEGGWTRGAEGGGPGREAPAEPGDARPTGPQKAPGDGPESGCGPGERIDLD
jgi:Family of unknown function (DUF5304)